MQGERKHHAARHYFETRDLSIDVIGLRMILYVTQIEEEKIYLTGKKVRAICHVQKFSPDFALLESTRCVLSIFSK